jgi:hypothetical protein
VNTSVIGSAVVVGAAAYGRRTDTSVMLRGSKSFVRIDGPSLANSQEKSVSPVSAEII